MEIVLPRLKYSLEHILEIKDFVQECDVQPILLSMFNDAHDKIQKGNEAEKQLAKETEKNITFEEFIRKLKEKDSLPPVETDPEQNIGRFQTRNFEKSNYYPETRNILMEPYMMIDPKCPVHSVQSKNSPLSFMPSSVAKKLYTKSSTEREQFVDPWQKMRSQPHTQLFESQSNKPLRCPHQFQTRAGAFDCYQAPLEMGRPINQDHEYIENRTDDQSSIDPKVLMIF
ncbi:hypothetical protein MXB_4622 [Myxobolus squamalis]|nr:hypothetical protein MXB_4622 [Myxobolus squamalis]